MTVVNAELKDSAGTESNIGVIITTITRSVERLMTPFTQLDH